MRVLVVGQVPPPYHGQAVMIKALLDGEYHDVRLFHVRMAFSSEIDQVGKVKLRKLWHLIEVIAGIIRSRVADHTEVIYYPPAGPRLVPVLRDIVILTLTRGLFRATIFHFQAGGVSEFLATLPRPVRWLAQRAFARPDVAITTAPSAPPDGKNLQARWPMVVPNAVDDPFGQRLHRQRAPTDQFRVLFVGHLSADKGVVDLCDAALMLMEDGHDVRVTCVGDWVDPGLPAMIHDRVGTRFASQFYFPGRLTGVAKDEQFRSADVFCFPSYYHSEAFPLVLVEAMAAGLPIVATRWRGIPDAVDEGANALLIEPRDTAACAAALKRLCVDPALCEAMGVASRARYVARFTLDAHRRDMNKALLLAKVARLT